jgi:hypothetical protein
MKPITDKPGPPLIEKLALLLFTVGIGTALMPLGVKFLTGMRRMSDAMVIIAVLGVILLIVGAVLAFLTKKRSQKSG